MPAAAERFHAFSETAGRPSTSAWGGMTSKQGYNGFRNYETWTVSLWMSNDRASYGYFRGLAQAACAFKQQAADDLAEFDSVAIQLSDALKREFEEQSPVRNHTTVYADLMNAALSEVDWFELATDLLDSIKEE